MVTFNFANPLHQFDNSSDSGHGMSTTTTKECYLVGTVAIDGGCQVTIDGHIICNSFTLYNIIGEARWNRCGAGGDLCYKLKAGTSVSVNTSCPYLYLLEEDA